MEEPKYDSLVNDMEEQQRDESGGTTKWIVRCGICFFAFIALIAINVLINTLDTVPLFRDMSPLLSIFAIPLFSLVLFALIVIVLLGSGTALWRLDNPPTKEDVIRKQLSRSVRMILKIDREIEEVKRSDKPEELKRMIIGQNQDLRIEVMLLLESTIKKENLDTTPEKLIERELILEYRLRTMNTLEKNFK